MEKVKVSVIVPNYNHAAFLHERISSIFNQSYQNFELIILDDCSTDNSLAIIEQFKEERAVSHVILNTKNSGSTFKQWEKGLKLAKGEFIWIAESDDFADRQFLEKAVEILNKNYSIGIFQCGCNWVDENGVILFSDSLEIKKGVTGGREFIKSDMTICNNIFNASAVVFRKNYLSLPLDSFITSFAYCGDWIFWIKILEKSNHHYLNENLNYFRKDPLGTSSIAHTKALFFTEGVRIFGYLKKAGIKKSTIFDKEERYLAFRFAQRNYPIGIMFEVFKNSFSAGLLLPAYVIWAYFKINILKIRTS